MGVDYFGWSILVCMICLSVRQRCRYRLRQHRCRVVDEPRRVLLQYPYVHLCIHGQWRPHAHPRATRAASQGDMYTRAGKWRGDASVPGEALPLGQDIEGMTLGIIGFGSIGTALAIRAQACGMKIIYHSRRRVPESEEKGAAYVSMDELLAMSDVISVNCPLTAETRHLLGPAEFSKMKTGVFIVNTARGAIIDEEALVEALKSGKVSRAGLDVFENEPTPHPGLLNPSLSHKITFQPHMTGRTTQSFVKGELELFKNLQEFMSGERPEYAVNDPKI
ncbi:D-isomer specific 2-hydroxyacid dehydrogenase [Mycena galopus ATCC 62051]|nr:D-isomer specific 2-hydroxyacid dehydrogenase [Mycena galopus ATCC 62051]